MHPLPRLRTRLLLGGIALLMTACSLLVNTDKDQCSADADCASSGAVCRQGVCVLASSVPDGGGDALADGATGPDPDAGCAPKVPASDLDFLNETCTTAQCIDFDNCARVGLCDGSLPPLVTPPAGGI